jgi:hypothetical protein
MSERLCEVVRGCAVLREGRREMQWRILGSKPAFGLLFNAYKTPPIFVILP